MNLRIVREDGALATFEQMVSAVESQDHVILDGGYLLIHNWTVDTGDRRPYSMDHLGHVRGGNLIVGAVGSIAHFVRRIKDECEAALAELARVTKERDGMAEAPRALHHEIVNASPFVRREVVDRAKTAVAAHDAAKTKGPDAQSSTPAEPVDAGEPWETVPGCPDDGHQPDECPTGACSDAGASNESGASRIDWKDHGDFRRAVLGPARILVAQMVTGEFRTMIEADLSRSLVAQELQTAKDDGIARLRESVEAIRVAMGGEACADRRARVLAAALTKCAAELEEAMKDIELEFGKNAAARFRAAVAEAREAVKGGA